MSRRASLTLAGLSGAFAATASAQSPIHSPLTLAPDTTGAGVIAAAVAASRRATVPDPGPGAAGRLLRDALARPHTLVLAPDTGLTLGRGVRSDRTLIVVGGPVRIAATVRGDLVVLGEIFLRPGAQIDGRAIAIGGGFHNSTLAVVREGTLAYQAVGFSQVTDGGSTTELRPYAIERGQVSRLTLPGTFGFRLPNYDRVNGLSISFGPELALDTGRVRINATATYRSQLGVVDPAVSAVAELGRRTVVEARAARATFTNDAWSRADLINAIVFAASGGDARNYYRADRADVTVARRYEAGGGVFEPIVGLLTERSWSAARDSASSRPFTLTGRDDVREGARRPNPGVTGGRITSALVGARAQRTTGGVRGRAEAHVEQALAVSLGDRFTRAVLDLSLERGEAGARQVAFFAHGAVTGGGRGVPSQRYAYLGGGPTLSTLYLLSQGGTELVWGEARYTVPVPRIHLPIVDQPPSITFRAAAGAAGVNTLPALTPNLGLRLSVAALRADFVFDPTGRSRGPQFSLGVGLR